MTVESRIMKRDDWYPAVIGSSFALFCTLYADGDVDFVVGFLCAILVFPFALHKSQDSSKEAK